ncbi:MAG: enoyl-CoA hydratase/isomerase family protein [Ilumatobacteraceae bacterium]
MSNQDLVLVESPSNGVFVLTLNAPKVNALSTALLERLHYLVTDLTLLSAHTVIITGGDRLFAAGAEISEFGGPSEANTIGQQFHKTLNAVAALPGFTIAAISGYALGGGCELAMACDYRIASTKAVFGQPEILLGIIPGGGGTQRLPRLVGASRAKELMMTGRQVKADEALRLGLADEVVEPDQLMARAHELALSIANGAAQASRIIKRVVDAGMNSTLEEGLRLELDGFVEVFETNDSQIGVKSFLENGPGKAAFTGS